MIGGVLELVIVLMNMIGFWLLVKIVMMFEIEVCDELLEFMISRLILSVLEMVLVFLMFEIM